MKKVVWTALIAGVVLVAGLRASDDMEAIVRSYLDVQSRLASDKVEGIAPAARAIAAQAARMGEGGAAIAKSAQALEQDIGAAVRQLLHADDAPHAAHLEHRRIAVVILLPSVLQQGHADALPAHRRVGDHLTVARLENVQGEIGFREKYDVGKGKNRDAFWDRERRFLFRMRPVRFRLHASR